MLQPIGLTMTIDIARPWLRRVYLTRYQSNLARLLASEQYSEFKDFDGLSVLYPNRRESTLSTVI